MSLEIFDDILNTDHRMFEFVLSFNINKKPLAQRKVYNFKKLIGMLLDKQ